MSTMALPATPVLNRLTGSFALPCRPRLAPRDVLQAVSEPAAITLAGLARPFQVKLASRREEYEQVFRLVASNYQAQGYEPPSNKPFRFTPYHALPETAIFVAKLGDRVMATLSLVPDSPVLGLPMEKIYAEELAALRQSGRKLVEVTSLADHELSIREFVPVFVGLMRVMTQFGVRQGADTWVITVNPRHCLFYRKMMGFVPIGPRRAYPSVQNHPAEAFAITVRQLARHSAAMYEQILDLVPEAALAHVPMAGDLVRYFAARSTQTSLAEVERVRIATAPPSDALV